MPRGAGDPVTNCNPAERQSGSLRAWGPLSPGVPGGGSTEAWTAAKGTETSPGAAAEGQGLSRWENGNFSSNIDVILRPESTRKTERQSTWARERHNQFSR